jgi:acyl-coenzyme A synthetase/AMP-(fatty) acid ligase/acyl carrier protein
VDSVWEIFGPLLQGVLTVIISDVVLKDPQALVQNLVAHRVTRIVLVPSLLRSILQNFPELQNHLPDLKIWITSGEALSKELAQQFWRSLPKSTLINLYGSSEVSADSTYYDTSEEKLHSCIPIGRPIDNTQVYLLDSNLNPVPIGVRGELYIGGEGLARGYLGRPELTKERFIENPFVKEPGSRLYKTGDLARYLPEGNIEFLGRIDHQVKVRGSRVELGEIETVLEQHPIVRQTVVVAREDIPGDKRLVAYLVPNEKETFSVSVLRDYLRKKLPEYMVPNAFLMLEMFPLTPSGKIDRLSLPSPTNLRPVLESAYLAPRTEIEQAIAAIWQEVLRLEKVGVNDNFFDLGGHSLVMAQVRTKLGQKLQRDLSMLELFIYPTINSLAQHLSQEKNEQISPRKSDDRIEKLKEGKDRLKQRIKHREQA